MFKVVESSWVSLLSSADGKIARFQELASVEKTYTILIAI